MATGDFDIESLARYLHLDIQKVKRMADRGELPGRKISGQWRFSEAEIHLWLEERIGASDDAELARVEEALQRSRPPEEDVCIAKSLPLEAIAIPLDARTRMSVIRRMVDLAAGTGWLWDPPKMVAAVGARENLHSTALGNGVAFLHPRYPKPNILAQAFLALGRTHHGIAFGGADGQLTDVFFLILSTDDSGHLRTLARLSRLISETPLLGIIRDAEDAATVHQKLAEIESAHFG
ncbi:MAG: helix-turn-helix domain-containing protein [Planctomycetes bacterium]|nr:helix-turn-helix domain-containing protein [Planctomycetota bacterium]